MTTPLAGDEPRILAAPTIGAAWLGAARAILDEGIETRYDGLPVREISLVTLAVSRPSSNSPPCSTTWPASSGCPRAGC